MDLGLRDRVALVTGASKGIGRGIAAELAAEGARVAVSSRSQERIEAVARDIGATAFVHDSADVGGAPALAEQVAGALGPLEILVCNTGGPPAPIRSASRATSGGRPTRRSCSSRWRWWRRSCPACASAASAAW